MTTPYPHVSQLHLHLFSSSLNREVELTIFLPPLFEPTKQYPLLLVNDGQDLASLGLKEMLNDLQWAAITEPIIVVGIHANHDRIYEYGTAIQPDYANRGNMAALTTFFILNELLPYLQEHYKLDQDRYVYAGFSLGGLMALDIAWNHSAVFSRVGVFSGALWWRQRALSEGYSDSDRIMHAQIRSTFHKPVLKFWFQCGTWDETDDRDQDGVIDSIQDTLECIAELERKGYHWHHDIQYLEVAEGTHDVKTWATAFPAFLIWSFGKSDQQSAG